MTSDMHSINGMRDTQIKGKLPENMKIFKNRP